MGIVEDLTDAGVRTLALASDLADAQRMGPTLPIVNPLQWELGHVAWFQELWTLRHERGMSPLRENGDALYDSARVAHDTRWGLRLPDRAATLAYLKEIHERCLTAAADGGDPERVNAFETA